MRHRRTIGVAFSPQKLQISEAPYPSNYKTSGEGLLLPPDPSEAQRMIARYVSENKLTGIPAVLGIPAEAVYLSLLTPPTRPRHMRETAVREHLQGLHALSGSETVSDVSSLPAYGKIKPMLISVARLDVVQELIAPLQAAGIRIEAAVPVSLAFFNLAAQHLSQRNARIIVLSPVGDSGIEILAGDKKTLLGIWRIPINSSENPQPDAAILTVKNELENAWRNKQADRLPPPTLVWGDNTPLADTTIAQLIRIFGAPPIPFFQWLSETSGDKRPITLPHVLAQNTYSHPGIHQDLLPAAMRERIHRQTVLPYRAVAAVLFAAFAISLSIYEFRQSCNIKRRLSNAEALWQNRQTLQETEQQLKIRNTTLSQQVGELRDSALSPLLIRDLLVAIAEAKHPDDWIVRIADAQSYFNAGAQPSKKAPENEPSSPFMFQPQIFIVEGYTPGLDLSSVRSFIETLRLHPQVTAVDLLGDDRVGPDRTPLMFRYIPRIHRFVMEVHIREP